jgi:hypothetical protein
VYLVAAWLGVQVSSTVLPMFDAPACVPRAIVIVLVLGFVPALIFAWVFELTPQGVKSNAEPELPAALARRESYLSPQGAHKLFHGRHFPSQSNPRSGARTPHAEAGLPCGWALLQ